MSEDARFKGDDVEKDMTRLDRLRDGLGGRRVMLLQAVMTAAE